MDTNVIKKCADQREQQAQREYTIADAISDAEWLGRTPDAVLDSAKMKRMIGTLLAGLQSSPCFYKAVQLNQEVFVLRQHDRAAPEAITEWAEIANEHGCSPAKVTDAFQMAARWRNQPISATKWPD